MNAFNPRSFNLTTNDETPKQIVRFAWDPGPAVVGASVTAGTDPAKLIRRGLPVATVQFVLDSGRLALAELDRIVLPRETPALAGERPLDLFDTDKGTRAIETLYQPPYPASGLPRHAW
jgi:hypothetical protein